MKPRLFIFGDSFVDWDIPKNHWTDYLSNHYDVFKHGKYGADNYSILFQLGNLPKYENGDRLIMYFTEPGRLPRRYYGKRKKEYINNIYMSPNFYEDTSFGEKLHILKFDESERWINGEREIEIKFLKNLKKWLSCYKPIFVTWSEHFHNPTKDFVNLIQVSSNFEEQVGDNRDFHPGPKGCYEVYKILFNLLEINDELKEYKKDLI